LPKTLTISGSRQNKLKTRRKKMDFLQRLLKIGKYYFAFTDDYRNFMEQQETSKIGKNRIVNYVRMDENGTSYKQYDNNGIENVEYEKVIKNINLRLSKYSNRKLLYFAFIYSLLMSAGSLLVIIFNFIKGQIIEELEPLYIICGFVIFTIAWIFLLMYFQKNKMAYLIYDISPDKEQQIQAFYDDLFKLKEAEKVWVVKDEDMHGDGRRNAGAASDVSRELTGIYHSYHSKINGLKINVYVPVIGGYLYFFPDALFVYRGKKIKTIYYRDIEIKVITSRFREVGEIPSDSEKIGSTWKYVNNDGSPDKRFNNNRKIPILKYCRIEITSENGFSMSLMVSNYEKGKDFANTIQTYKLKA
jgi:hypothetical protein